ncbi:TRAF family member-associated NF-kappa-B activator isoform X2 [Phyllopteryx taeniolatus]|uniref:TRAF family member-associated NF-kappa-B activator isoform X2 n=1 Tax=Phyllopteryx taeniolatus TaxID=161469 RepID=UPI002AD58204|nr:TRAF family member-associated NF-kappa-B activator isoform X2 [Phyllopteryx taeniolatus]
MASGSNTTLEGSSGFWSHVCSVSDDCGVHGMERNIGDQLNKAFEAYRQVSIEKDNAKKELQQMTEYYQQYIQKLQRQIEDQQQLIAQLKAQLSATRKPSGEVKWEPCIHLVDGGSTHGKIQHPETKGTVAVPLKTVNNSIDYQDMLDALEAIHGTFRQIRSLSRRQKDYLKRFRGGIETANDQQFSMPIQCTDRAAEAETPFFSATRSTVDIPLAPTSLASRGASPDDRDFVDSLTKFSVKFPPPADSEYDFLNSAPEGHVALTVPMRRPLSGMPPAANNNEEEDEPSELPVPFVIPVFPSHTTSSSLSQEDVRGPQQSLWSPELCEATDVGAELATTQSSIPDKCAFCHAVVPQEQMNSHLYSHFSPKDETHR